jgi:hypothetical protein
MLLVINSMEGPNILVSGVVHRLPKILQNNPSAAAIAAFLGDVTIFRIFVDLGFDHMVRDDIGRTLMQFAYAGGNFAVVRELDITAFNRWANCASLCGQVPSGVWPCGYIALDVDKGVSSG